MHDFGLRNVRSADNFSFFSIFNRIFNVKVPIISCAGNLLLITFNQQFKVPRTCTLRTLENKNSFGLLVTEYILKLTGWNVIKYTFFWHGDGGGYYIRLHTTYLQCMEVCIYICMYIYMYVCNVGK